MARGSVKLASFIVFVAIASFVIPFTAEARSKKGCHTKSTPAPAPTPAGIPPYQIHGCGYPCSDSNDCDAPCTICCANQTCCYDEPFVLPPLPPPASPPPPPVLSPAPVPYQIHGCGYPCSDSNDCDWPCTICCANQTCCYDVPFDLSPPPPPPPPVSPPPVLSPAPVPYQIHGCGYPCSDSNDCDWPCTYCCWQNQTCCYEPSFYK